MYPDILADTKTLLRLPGGGTGRAWREESPWNLPRPEGAVEVAAVRLFDFLLSLRKTPQRARKTQSWVTGK